MNKFKKMMSVTLASCMAASALMMSAGAANTPVDTGTATLAPNVISNTTINQLKATAQNAIEQFFRESDKDLYSLVGFRFDDGEVTQSDDSVQYKTTVTVSERLKAQSVEEMPYIAGYLDELGASSYATMAASDKAELAKSAFGLDQDTALTEAQQNVVDTFVQSMDTTVEMFDEYIGETSDFTYHIKVSAPVAEPDNITLTGLDEFDNDVNINEYELRSYDEIYRNGAEDAQAAVQSMMISPAWVATKINNYNSYNRIAARDYAYKYWSSYNPAYTSYKGNGGDCANFVSQCIHAGGIPTDATWKADSVSWIRASAVPSYMMNKGYATKTSYTNATAGNFAYTSSGAGHAVLVTINDGAKIAYTAHTTDRKDAAFSSTDLNGNYSFYVIKNY
ncbi:amidase domain-containing protein [Agathobaculum butyriciproducens]|uniref:amidase domain-containing protein n=1 Tax=Agathobaculum butyriciproducens TaxID=1628085 RepID=UPI003A91D477